MNFEVFYMQILSIGLLAVSAHFGGKLTRHFHIGEVVGQVLGGMVAGPIILFFFEHRMPAYRQALEDMMKDEAAAVDVYMRQVFGLARVNAEKYKNIRRAVLLVIIALATELTLVAYLFIYYHGQGAILLPPITGL